jgi:hypothetical protein
MSRLIKAVRAIARAWRRQLVAFKRHVEKAP